MIVDLGCGSTKRGDVGVDIVAAPGVDHVVNLGFEALPFADGEVDKFLAFDVLEHIAPVAHVREVDGSVTTLRPGIFLWNEIYRCLRSGGTFEHSTPCFPAQEVFQDPTHVAVYTENTMLYYSTKFGTHLRSLVESYGITAHFVLAASKRSVDGSHLQSVLVKP